MPVLGELLERLRRVRLPPGAAAGVPVPTAGAELSGEVALLFGRLDEIEQRGGVVVSTARSEAAELEAVAVRERSRLLEDARAEAERIAAKLLAELRASSQERARSILADAERDAERVLARGRERTPGLVQEVIAAVLESER
jgi:vacuolar-type H+-ATPase subunit H